MTLSIDLKAPDEITFAEVSAYWERCRERIWCNGYTVYISPNKDLKAWTNDAMQQIALMYNIYTGQVHQVRPEALYDLFKQLGGWI